MRVRHFLFVGSIFLGASLLFLIEPYAARVLLPRFGGSPSVWNTSLVFFQVVLLLGYLYAHGLAVATSGTRQLVVHLVVLLLPLLFLPPLLPAGVHASADRWPAFAVLAGLTAMVGAPFFVLSTNSSLIQHWWARTRLPGSQDPYWLYGASNLGSLLALLAYPFLVEPSFDLDSQARGLAVGYMGFVLITAGAMVAAHRASVASSSDAAGSAFPAGPLRSVARDVDEPSQPGGSAAASDGQRVPAATVGPGRRTLWVARAAIGSSLLLSVTMRITTDVASVPLFWVVPLAIYLVTFIVAFGLTDRLPRGPLEAGVAVAIAAVAGMPLALSYSFGVVLSSNLLALFFGALLCHRDLAADRPHPSQLTAFYLWVSFGGALGGILNSLVAPVVFHSVAEYPLTLLAVAVLLHAAPEQPRGFFGFRPSWPVAMLTSAALILPIGIRLSAGIGVAAWIMLVLLAIAWGLALSRYVGFVVLSVLVATLFHFTGSLGGERTLAEERSFFGVIRVKGDDRMVTMVHGVTIHGTQLRDPGLREIPSAYYHPEGPMGAAVLAQPSGAHIGVVGLGAGALAVLSKPGQEMVYHEIDPLVVAMARKYFTYLADARGTVSVVLGDGRITLEDVPDRRYDLLIIDAFSSDVVPTHLLTVEALNLYLAKVRPGGLVLLHLSNRYADLRRVVMGYSAATGNPVAFDDYLPSDDAKAEGAIGCRVAAIAPDPRTVAALLREPAWEPMPPDVTPVVWTDARVDLPTVLDWK